MSVTHANIITALSTQHRLLSIGPLELSGGLMAYGVNFNDQFRRAAVFVDKILKAQSPAIFRSNKQPNSRRSSI